MKNLAIIKLALKSNWIFCLITAFLIVLFVSFGVKYKQNNATVDNPKMSAVIIDEDKSAASALVIQRFRENNFVNIVDDIDYDAALKGLFQQEFEVIFLIKEGFEEKILSGKIKECVELQYSQGNITSEMIGEVLTREIFRLFISEKGIRDIERQYKKEQVEFTPQMRIEATAYTEEFWQDEATVQFHISYAESANDLEKPSDFSYKALITDIFVYIGILLMILPFANELILQKNNGVMKLLKLQGIGYVRYASLWISVKVAVVLCIFFMVTVISGILSLRESLAYIQIIGISAIISLLLGKLPNGKLLFSLIPLIAIVLALAKAAIFTL